MSSKEIKADSWIEAELDHVDFNWTPPTGDPIDTTIQLTKYYNDVRFASPGITQLRVKVNQPESSKMLSQTGDLMRLSISYNDESKPPIY